MKRFGALACLLALGACATAAQNQAEQIRKGNSETIAELKLCRTMAYTSPGLEDIRLHIPAVASRATMAQMADTSKITPAEVPQISSLHDALSACRATAVSEVSTYEPTLAPILAHGGDLYDASTLALVQSKISWGDYVQALKQNDAVTNAAIVAAQHSINQQLEASHEAEMERRQAVSQALLNYSAQMNAQNHVVNTSCTRFGNTVNCTSQ